MRKGDVSGHLAVVVGLAALAWGCDSSQSTVGTSNPVLTDTDVTSLHFSASNVIGNSAPAIDVTLTDPMKSNDIYVATMALPSFPAGRVNCPADGGLRYSIEFMSGSSAFTSAVVSPTGCTEARVTTAAGSSMRIVSDPSYWATLAGNLGIPESGIYPAP
jgi:hypothetical protein